MNWDQIREIEAEEFALIGHHSHTHGYLVDETNNKPSPMPNNIRPKHKKNKVENFGFKLKGLDEVQESLGIFLMDKNIDF